ncbi:MAG: NHLP family bacteriocin export ABC transporter peptidase/permease/ATPase subunit [Gammaproteobacteria bacterium]|nr:NHLP family bacteriocin export ABC transporter peptidase/permease/ATPase subunit [Gammaproteobacteria bacterium]
MQNNRDKFLSQRVKTPTLLQMEAVECGAAALGIILAYYGYHKPLEELRVDCGVSRDGSKASNIVKAARRYGMTAKGQRVETHVADSIKVPFIAFWNFNHFVVVEGFSKKCVYLNDPASGPKNISWSEFEDSYTGVILEIEPDKTFKPAGKKPSIFPGLKKRIENSYTVLLFIFLTGLALIVPGIIIPAFSKIFVDDILLAQRQDWVGPVLFSMLVVLIVQWSVGWLQSNQLTKLETQLAIKDSSNLIWHILHLPIVFFTQRYTGDLVSRLTISDRLAQLLSRDLATNLLNILLAVFYALIMFKYSVVLTLVAISTVALNLLAVVLLARSRTDENRRFQTELGKLNGTAMNGLSMIDSLKASGSEDDFFSRWAGYQAKAVNASQVLGRASQLLLITPTTLTIINTVAILVIGGELVILGHLTAGDLVAFQLLTSAFIAPVNALVSVNNQLQEAHGDLMRVDDIYNYPIDPLFTSQAQKINDNESAGREGLSNAQPAPDSKLSGNIEITDLCFGYNPLEPPLISGFNLTLTPGKRVALVGGSGSGKSTLARLIAGLYQPWSGAICFDGVKREDCDLAIIQNSLTTVDQNVSLFSGTIKENLCLWNENIRDEVIIQAIKDADIHQLIAERGGLKSRLNENGDNISGGQKQRIEIARALCIEPTILIMDEATSALDSATEYTIDMNIRRRGCTSIIVAHRLSTIRDCDEIIVMEQGVIIQRGDHNTLLQDAQGNYARLINEH